MAKYIYDEVSRRAEGQGRSARRVNPALGNGHGQRDLPPATLAMNSRLVNQLFRQADSLAKRL